MIRLLPGDCREVLATLPADSVHCVVTSPPYYGLRDYGTAQWAGGDAACDHVKAVYKPASYANGRGEIGNGCSGWRGNSRNQSEPYGDVCGKCGATRVDRQIGLEPTPDAYLAEMVGVFREVRRVMRPDATCWINLGDSYRDKQLLMMPARLALALQADGWWLRSAIVWAKPNPMPESVGNRPTSAYEMVYLLAKGQWRERSIELTNLSSERRHFSGDSGTNSPDAWACKFGVCLATAILDRTKINERLGGLSFESKEREQCTGALGRTVVVDLPPIDRIARYAAHFLHSDISPKEFLCEIQRVGLVLSEKDHFVIRGSDAKIPFPPSVNRYGETSIAIHDAGKIGEFELIHGRIVARWATTCSYFYDADAVREAHEEPWRSTGKAESRGFDYQPHNEDIVRGRAGITRNAASEVRQYNPAGRNLRNWWVIATAPYSEAHFATFPPALAERCIRAGTSERGCCAACGAPWGRQTDTAYERNRHGHSGRTDASGSNGWDGGAYPNLRKISTTIGWAPSCACGADTVPCTVLDPFGGAGTTALVADRLQRDAILIELNPDYTRMAMDRCRDDAPLFAEPSPPPAEDPEEARVRDLFAEPLAAD